LQNGVFEDFNKEIVSNHGQVDSTIQRQAALGLFFYLRDITNLNRFMYYDVKKALEFIQEHKAVKFEDLFKNIIPGLSSLDRNLFQEYLVEQNLVANFDGEGKEFGQTPDYTLTKKGTALISKMQQAEVLDRILRLLDEKGTDSYTVIKDVCDSLEVEYTKTYEVRLANDELVTTISGKEGKYYQISIAGEVFISEGGYTEELVNEIEVAIANGSERPKPSMPSVPPVQHTTTITAQNYVANTNSTITNQTLNSGDENKRLDSQKNEPASEESKIGWRKIIIAVGSIAALIAAIIKVIIEFF
jgi:hypothetical protein